MFDDHKPQSNAICILSLGVLDESKELEKFILVFVADTSSGVLHTHYQEVWILGDHYGDMALFREFNGVRLQVQQDLLDTLFVMVDKVLIKLRFKLKENGLGLCFLLLDAHYFFDCLSNVEIT
jgi:hypothetical protein